MESSSYLRWRCLRAAPVDCLRRRYIALFPCPGRELDRFEPAVFLYADDQILHVPLRPSEDEGGRAPLHVGAERVFRSHGPVFGKVYEPEIIRIEIQARKSRRSPTARLFCARLFKVVFIHGSPRRCGSQHFVHDVRENLVRRRRKRISCRGRGDVQPRRRRAGPFLPRGWEGSPRASIPNVSGLSSRPDSPGSGACGEFDDAGASAARSRRRPRNFGRASASRQAARSLFDSSQQAFRGERSAGLPFAPGWTISLPLARP